MLSANGITAIDTSQTYGNSETILGRVNAGDSFTISTKWGVLEAYTDHSIAWASKEYIIRTARQSIARLGVKQVDIFYLHFPDRNTPLEETLAGVDAAYREGLFRRFGVSNFTAEAVQTIHDIATAKGYVLPTVYQGQYNPVARHFETDLFPTLRKLGMVFYAYSPLAGGFLTKTVEDFYAGKGRFGKQRLLQHIQQTVVSREPRQVGSCRARRERVSRRASVPLGCIPLGAQQRARRCADYGRQQPGPAG